MKKPRSDDLYSPKEKLADRRDVPSFHRSHRYKSECSQWRSPSRHDWMVECDRRISRHEYRAAEGSDRRRDHWHRGGGDWHRDGSRIRRFESSSDYVKGFRSQADRYSMRRRYGGEDGGRRHGADSGRVRHNEEDTRRNRDVISAIRAPGGEFPEHSEAEVKDIEQLQRHGGSCSEMEEGELKPEPESVNSRDFHDENECSLGCLPCFGGDSLKIETMRDGNEACNNACDIIIGAEQPNGASGRMKERNDFPHEEDSLQEKLEGIHCDDIDIGGELQTDRGSMKGGCVEGSALLEEGQNGIREACSTGVEDSYGGDTEDLEVIERTDVENGGEDVLFCDIVQTKGETVDVSGEDNPPGKNSCCVESRNSRGFHLFGCHFFQSDAMEVEPVEPLELSLCCTSVSFPVSCTFPEFFHGSYPHKGDYHSSISDADRNKGKYYNGISHVKSSSETEMDFSGRNRHPQDESCVSHGYENVPGDPPTSDLRFRNRTGNSDDIESIENGVCLVGGSGCNVDEQGPDFVDTMIRVIVSEQTCVVMGMFQQMSGISLSSLKEGVFELIFGEGNPTKLSGFQKILEKRVEITLEMLLKCHRTQLEIMVALRTGMSYFVTPNNEISSYEMGEIFLHTRCKNLNCRSSLPIDGHDCRICSQKSGFCCSCMCLICSGFDMAYNTCSWVGCDMCLHWCHTYCALGNSLIINGANGMDSMHFNCIVCSHQSEMYGFVKEVFESFAKTWPRDTLCNELECIERVFRDSVDCKGRQLYDVVNGVLQKLVSGSTLSDAYRPILLFFSGGHSGRWGGKAEVSMRKEGLAEELAEMARVKRAEAEAFQVKADSARREGEGLRATAEAEMEKIEEGFRRGARKVGLVEAEERQRQIQKQVEALEAARHVYMNIKSAMESDVKHLLFRLEATRRSLAR